MLSTSDGGTTWSDLTAPPGLSLADSLACISSVRCLVTGYVTTGGLGIYLTTDGGQSWIQASGVASSDSTNIEGITCPSTSQCWAVGYDTTSGQTLILQSSDAGATWEISTSVSLLSLQPFIFGGGISCVSASECTVVGVGTVGNNQSNAVSMTTKDGGAIWTSATMSAGVSGQVLSPTSIQCTSTTNCTAVGFSVNANFQSFAPLAWYSTDAGATWSEVYPPGATAAFSVLTSVSCPTASSCFAVGFNITDSSNNSGVPVGATVVATTDGGATWSKQAIASPQDQLLALVGVSCVSVTSCEAGGALFTSSTSVVNYNWATAVLTPGENCVSSAPLGPTSVSKGYEFPSTIPGPVSATVSGTQGAVSLSGITPNIPYTLSVSATSAAGTGCPGYLASDVMDLPLQIGTHPLALTASSPPTVYCPGNTNTGAGGTPRQNLSQCDLPDPDAVSDPLSTPTNSLMDVFTTNSTAGFFPADNIPWFQYRETTGASPADSTWGTSPVSSGTALTAASAGSWVYPLCGLLAPGVAQVDGVWLLFYDTGSTPRCSPQNFCIGVAALPGPLSSGHGSPPQSPVGAYGAVDPRQPLLCAGATRGSYSLGNLGGVIDPQPTRIGNQWYLEVKTGNAPGGPAARLYAIPFSVGASGVTLNLSGSSELKSQPVNCSGYSNQSFCTFEASSTIEAPDLVNSGVNRYQFFSTGLWNTVNYQVGYATCPIGGPGAPLQPCNNNDQPILANSSSAPLGPGGESVFSDVYGTPWMVYAGWNTCSGPAIQPGESQCNLNPAGTSAVGVAVYRQLWASEMTFPNQFVAMTPDPQGGGYWMVQSDGTVWGFGNAVA